MYPHVHAEGGIISKLLVANLTAVAGPVFGTAQRSLDVGQDVLLQGGVGGKPTAAGPDRAFERRLARVGHPVEVEALLGHATVAAEVTLDLTEGQKKKKKEIRRGSRDKEGQLEEPEKVGVSAVGTTRSRFDCDRGPLSR